MPAGYYERPERFCSVDGCSNKHYGRGYCSKHYQRIVRHDSLVTERTEYGLPLKWLREQLESRSRQSCWEWPFGTNDKGYGIVVFKGRGRPAHRVAMILDGRPTPKPPNHHGLHNCDNPSCCNPDHCRWGTNQDNVADKMNRGRDQSLRGEDVASAKLTTSQVLAIREDPRLRNQIAKSYGVSFPTIDRIKRRQGWKHLP